MADDGAGAGSEGSGAEREGVGSAAACETRANGAPIASGEPDDGGGVVRPPRGARPERGAAPEPAPEPDAGGLPEPEPELARPLDEMLRGSEAGGDMSVWLRSRREDGDGIELARRLLGLSFEAETEASLLRRRLGLEADDAAAEVDAGLEDAADEGDAPVEVEGTDEAAASGRGTPLSSPSLRTRRRGEVPPGGALPPAPPALAAPPPLERGMLGAVAARGSGTDDDATALDEAAPEPRDRWLLLLLLPLRLPPTLALAVPPVVVTTVGGGMSAEGGRAGGILARCSATDGRVR